MKEADLRLAIQKSHPIRSGFFVSDNVKCRTRGITLFQIGCSSRVPNKFGLSRASFGGVLYTLPTGIENRIAEFWGLTRVAIELNLQD